jgi:hypothetical protein
LIGGKRKSFGLGKLLPEFGYVTLGSPVPQGSGRTRTESGFQGKLARVQVWNRELTAGNEIQNQVKSCRSAPILFDGLILRWSGYDLTVGGVDRIMPSVCGEYSCPLGRSGEKCETVIKDKEPPEVISCDKDKYIALHDQNSATVEWDEPLFQDLSSIDLKIHNKDGLLPGQPLQQGTYLCV